ncbi:MAG TPA: Fic family protein [Rhizomicrobium sp.]|jgi:cell filamentation protein|nr:Fic family protein [Rhizomicrobium sp.]
MYDIADDAYCYSNSTVLKNIPGLRTQRALKRYEIAMTAQRAEEPLPPGRLGVSHYCAIHRHLFQDVYSWAGKFRRIRIAKSGSMFCYPENIAREMSKLFSGLRTSNYLGGLSADKFAHSLAGFLTELNAIHPFRDGNGRAQLGFAALVATRAGHPLDFAKLRPAPFLKAMIASFHGDEEILESHIFRLMPKD